MSTVSNGPVEGQDIDPPPVSTARLSPEHIAEGNRIMDEIEALFARPKPPSDGDGNGGGDDEEPPTSRCPPPGPLSHLAVRLDDGAFLVSLEDAADRDVSGRETITFLVLTSEEKEHALPPVSDAIFAAAANIVGRLPKRKP